MNAEQREHTLKEFCDNCEAGVQDNDEYGHWHLIRSDKEETAEMCSVCSGTIVRKSYHKSYKYCPHCGKKMIQENK